MLSLQETKGRCNKQSPLGTAYACCRTSRSDVLRKQLTRICIYGGAVAVAVCGGWNWNASTYTSSTSRVARTGSRSEADSEISVRRALACSSLKCPGGRRGARQTLASKYWPSDQPANERPRTSKIRQMLPYFNDGVYHRVGYRDNNIREYQISENTA
jgi:hypothetical protein